MLSRRGLFLAIAVSAFSTACREKEKAHAQTGALEATDAVDPAFVGCSQSCGLHSGRERKLARAQPGANEGDVTFCPVSGAVFRVTPQTPQRAARGKVLFFCCEACAAFFTQHEAQVLERRGLG